MEEKINQIKKYLDVNNIKNFGIIVNKNFVSIDTNIKEIKNNIKFELKHIMQSKDVLLTKKNEKYNQIIITI